MVRSRSRNGLYTGNSAFGNGLGIGTEDELRCRSSELWQASDWKIFMVDRGSVEEYLLGL
ncbi:aspartate aminotransferase, partial [Moniliophthora roreri]